MFIGWLKLAEVNELVSISQEVGWLVDGYHIKLMLMHSPHLCYGAYQDGKLVGAILSIEFEHSAQVKYFMIQEKYQKQGIGKRLFETMIGALNNEYNSIYLHANPALVPFFTRYGFESKMKVGRFINAAKPPPFNFTNVDAKELEGNHFESIITSIDKETFNENRMDFLFDEIQRDSSLKFTLKNGFQHSSVVNSKNVYLGPWQVRYGYKEEAEKMMQGLLYYRGLKHIVADIPLEVEEVVTLFKKYNFEHKQSFVHMSRGNKNDVKFKNIYAFSL